MPEDYETQKQAPATAPVSSAKAAEELALDIAMSLSKTGGIVHSVLAGFIRKRDVAIFNYARQRERQAIVSELCRVSGKVRGKEKRDALLLVLEEIEKGMI